MIIVYLLGLLGLLVYSFSQIDLNLTLIQTSWFLTFQDAMIQLGYFNRPLSTYIFIFLTLLLTAFYCFFLYNAEKLPKKTILILLGGLSILALFSYPAFSHDVFNGMFNARQIIVYHVSPYTTTPLMFPHDAWIRFMQWTHATYPWGPAFLFFSLPFYLLGLEKFTLTLISFKLMALLAFLGSAYIINKFSSKKGVIFFILNPLIIYEALVAAHLDILMLFFALLSWYLWQKKKFISSLVSLLISIAVKYATVTLLPAFVMPHLLIGLAFLGTLGQILSRELLPHYFIVPIGFAALFAHDKKIVTVLVIATFALLLLRYVPFLSSGQWLTIKLF